MAKRQTKNKRKRSVLAPSPPQMVILRVCMVLLALLLALSACSGQPSPQPQQPLTTLQELQELLANPAALPDLTGCKINHKMFGAGTVRPAEGQFMVIDFNGTLKKFSYTASMNSGYLSAEDPNVEARLQAYQDYNKDKDRLEKELKNLKAELVKL
mgnify:CR=1 FL=1